MEGVYKFRLQKLLNIREDFEEKSKIDFKEAQTEKKLVENKLYNLEEKYKTHRNVDAYQSVVQQKIRQNYLNILNFAINDATSVLEEKEEMLDEKRKKLKQCQIEKKTVEILKEKQMNAFLKEKNLIEQKTNDEFALYAFIRNKHRERR